MTVTIEKRGRRIEIRSAEPLPGLRTTVPGAYETAAGYWTVPLSLESCKLLREKYGQRLRLGKELRRWVHVVVHNREYMAELAAAKDAKLEVLPTVAPKLYKAMNKRKYQRVGARFIADNHATLVADDPGLGKTLIAMGGILEAEIPGPYLVVAPKTAADSVWRREILRWLPKNHRAVILPEYRDARDRKIRLTRYGEFTWLIVHPEIVLVQSWWECTELVPEMRLRRKTAKSNTIRKRLTPTGNMVPCGKRTEEGNAQKRILDCGHIKTRKTKKIVAPSYPKLFDIDWGAVIVDESHECLIRRSGTPTQRRRGLDMLKLRGDGIRLAMSGTPFDSKPHQLWGTLNWLDSYTYSAFHRWSELYWQKGGYTGYQIGEFRKDREEMLWDSLSAVALRRTKAEVAPDLPPKTYVGSPLSPSDEDSPIGIWLEMEGKQAKAYEEIEKLSVAELDSGRLETITALAELTRLKQLACAYGKLDIRMIRVRCSDLMKKHPHIYKKKCNYCRRQGWHKEPKQFYTPELPSNKFNWIIESLEEWGYPKNPIDKVVIVSFYTGILEMMGAGIERHFKTKSGKPLCTAITGRTRSVDRRSIIDGFNEMGKPPQVMLLNVKAGGTAITIDSADRMIFISETRIPDQQKQAEDRIHRVSNPRHCMYYYLRSLGTVDIGTALVNQEMDRETHRLLDERRGVEYMRQVVNLSHSP
jgi:SNF2 family DNA or RNA helicase